MDPLSDMLTMLTIERVHQTRCETSGDYAFRFGPFEHVKIGAVLLGEMLLRVEGRPQPLELKTGDCFLLTNSQAHSIATAEGLPERDGKEFFAEHRDAFGVVRFGDGPPDKISIGGRFVFDAEGAAWLRAALPPIIHIPAASPHAAPLRMTMKLLSAELGGGTPGEAVIVDRLGDILLVQVLRAHLAATGPDEASWLAGLADPRIGRALKGFHDDVAADWTVADLASAAGMSRSSFAERFRARVGMAPLDYLTRWRLQRVRRALIETDLPFGTIAARNGYRSRSSCSQSFKRLFGYSPYDLRKGRGEAEGRGKREERAEMTLPSVA